MKEMFILFHVLLHWQHLIRFNFLAYLARVNFKFDCDLNCVFMVAYEIRTFFSFVFNFAFFSSEIALHNFGLIDIQIVFLKNWYKNFRILVLTIFADHFDEKLWVIAALVSFLYRAQFSQVLCIFFLSDVGDFGKKCLLPVNMKNSAAFISNSLKFLSSVFNSLTSQKFVLCLLWGKDVIHAECLFLSWTFLFNGFSLQPEMPTQL